MRPTLSARQIDERGSKGNLDPATRGDTVPRAARHDYLGDWTDRACNRNIEQDNLRTFLRDRQSYGEALFLARYIEKYGTGTLMMIRESLAHALPEPDFTQRGGEFTITLWRDRLTGDVLAKLQLNERQLKGLACLRAEGHSPAEGIRN